MKKRILVVAAIVFQVGAVAMMAISKEWVLATGEEFVLQTAPIDPRDIFRGDYVRLKYAFSELSLQQLQAGSLEKGLKKGQKVYLPMLVGPYGIAEAGLLQTAVPDEGNFLTGRVLAHWPYRGWAKRKKTLDMAKVNAPLLRVKYGIEQYYVEQGQGLEMEKIRGSRNSFQVPMLIHAAFSGSGAAVIRSFEWANIATKTEIAKSPERDASDDEASAIMKFTLSNRSDRDFGVAWTENGCSFKIVPSATNPSNVGFDRSECDGIAAENRVLKAGDELSLEFDLNLPRFRVMLNGKKMPLGKLPWNYRYRVVYVGEKIEGINANIVSRAFHGRGQVD